MSTEIYLRVENSVQLASIQQRESWAFPTLFCTSTNFANSGKDLLHSQKGRSTHFFFIRPRFNILRNLTKVTIPWKPLGKLTVQGLITLWKGKCVVSISLELAPFSNNHRNWFHLRNAISIFCSRKNKNSPRDWVLAVTLASSSVTRAINNSVSVIMWRKIA